MLTRAGERGARERTSVRAPPRDFHFNFTVIPTPPLRRRYRWELDPPSVATGSQRTPGEAPAVGFICPPPGTSPAEGQRLDPVLSQAGGRRLRRQPDTAGQGAPFASPLSAILAKPLVGPDDAESQSIRERDG